MAGKKVHMHRNMGQYLTPDEQRDVTAFLDGVPRSLLTAEQERTADVDTLLLHNMRLAARVAIIHNGRGVPLADLLQEASMGVWRAAKGYKPELGFRFSTYASQSARLACRRAIEEGGLIRLPSHLQQNRSDQHKNARSSTLALAERARAIESLDAAVEGASEASQDGGENASMIDNIDVEDNDAADAALKLLDEQEARDLIARVMPMLTEREREVIALRYGLPGSQPLTQAQTGVALDITRERVRQIENKAMDKMRKALASEMENGL